MGILNVTPDSFSGDGLLQTGDPLESALVQARAFTSAGADMLDVGGESTRPGSQPVEVEEELTRVLPVVRALAGESEVMVSVDTSKALVARQAFWRRRRLGQRCLGAARGPGPGRLWRAPDAPVVLMHNRCNPASAEVRERLGGRYVGMKYANLLGEVKSELMESVALARAAGVAQDGYHP